MFYLRYFCISVNSCLKKHNFRFQYIVSVFLCFWLLFGNNFHSGRNSLLLDLGPKNTRLARNILFYQRVKKWSKNDGDMQYFQLTVTGLLVKLLTIFLSSRVLSFVGEVKYNYSNQWCHFEKLVCLLNFVILLCFFQILHLYHLLSFFSPFIIKSPRDTSFTGNSAFPIL